MRAEFTVVLFPVHQYTPSIHNGNQLFVESITTETTSKKKKKLAASQVDISKKLKIKTKGSRQLSPLVMKRKEKKEKSK